jgi:hypothetical protein
MTMCLSDRVLWALSEGDGTAAEREHLERCQLCAHRARQLDEDLVAIGKTLRGPVPAGAVVVSRPKTVNLAWALLAAVIVLGFVGFWSARSVPVGAPAVAVTDGVAALTDLSTRVFAEDGQSIRPATDLEVIATALDSAGPCEWQPGGCEDEGEPLF